MGEVTITINGHSYGIYCDDGQEQRVMDLSHHVDRKMRDISRAGAANNDSHLLVLTAIMLADEAFDLRDNLVTLGDGISETASDLGRQDSGAGKSDAELARTIERLASRIDLVAGRIAQKA